MKTVAHKTVYGYEYKGKCIKKKTYSMFNVTWWVVDGKEFNTLKEAKQYIDSLEV